MTAGLVLAGVFLLGGMAGAGLAVAWIKRDDASLTHPRERHRRQVEALARELSLDSGQRERVQGALEQARPAREEAIRAMVRGCGTRFLAQREAEDARIREVLNPTQRERFDALMRKRRERWAGKGPLGLPSAAPGPSASAP
jgi:Spy/CpxP family protein refolding chaperone